MAVSGKWIEGVTPDSKVSDVAQRSLQARLVAVQHQLPLAALAAEQDVEHVHRLRVATRRAVAALKLYKNFYPPRRCAELGSTLNDIRRAAGAARDLDVLSIRLEEAYGQELGQVSAQIAARRDEAQVDIKVAYDAAMLDGVLPTLTAEILDRVRPRRKRDKKSKHALFAAFAQRQLLRTAGKFFDAQPANSYDFPALHQFRVRGKQLRYVMELLAGAFSPEFRQKLYPRVEELQSQLGRINDHYSAVNQLESWQKMATCEDDSQLLARLADAELVARQAAVADFDAWWTQERAAELQRALIGQDDETPHAARPGENGAVSQGRRASAP